jgi:hypothetical protein
MDSAVGNFRKISNPSLILLRELLTLCLQGWFVSLKVFNILGEEIATLVHVREAGKSDRFDFNADRLQWNLYLQDCKRF